MFSMAMWMAALVAPVQMVAGDFHGINTLEHQPAKIAAIEGHFETQAPAPLILFGMPNMEAERTEYAVEIPYLGSLILTHTLDGAIRGLDDLAQGRAPLRADRVLELPRDGRHRPADAWRWACGACVLRWRGRLYDAPLMHRAAVADGPGRVRRRARRLGHHRGRPPALHRLRPAHHRPVAPRRSTPPRWASSLVAFILVYFALFGVGVFYILRLMAEAPHAGEPGLPPDEPIRAAGIMPAPGHGAGRRPAAGGVRRRWNSISPSSGPA